MSVFVECNSKSLVVILGHLPSYNDVILLAKSSETSRIVKAVKGIYSCISTTERGTSLEVVRCEGFSRFDTLTLFFVEIFNFELKIRSKHFMSLSVFLDELEMERTSSF